MSEAISLIMEKIRCGTQIESEIYSLIIKRAQIKLEVDIAKAALNVIDTEISNRRKMIKSLVRITKESTRG